MKRLSDHFLVGCGWTSLALGVVGIFLPLVPTAPFVVLAAYCFSKGSPRLHQWLRRSRHFGPVLIDWEDRRVIRPGAKAFALVMMTAGAVASGYRLYEAHLEIAIGVWVILASAAFFILRQKSR